MEKGDLRTASVTLVKQISKLFVLFGVCVRVRQPEDRQDERRRTAKFKVLQSNRGQFLRHGRESCRLPSRIVS